MLFLFWMQPASAIRALDFWLPAGMLALVAAVWSATLGADASGSHPEPKAKDLASRKHIRAHFVDAAALAGIVLLIAATRYTPALCCVVTRTRPPEITSVLLALAGCIGACALARRLPARGLPAQSRAWLWGGITLLIALLLVIKVEPLTVAVSGLLRVWQGQDPAQAGAADWRWLGFSYVAFRLISMLRDRMAGRLPALRLREVVSYALFAPVLIAGPIDRADRFVKDMRAPYAPTPLLFWEGGARILFGLFKKFALADTLALIALSDQNAAQLRPGWAWLPLYAYALRIWLDFSGYTDIALGVARWLGFALPENFNAPYLKPNLTQFWNSWHMSLSTWFRSYWFNPLSRALRGGKAGGSALPVWAMILIAQSSTMLLIGFWHGVTINFVIWGMWHALGLFAHNRWADYARSHLSWVSQRPRLQRLVNIAGALATFHFVALGWVWFALSTPALGWAVIQRLFGVGP